MAFKEYIKSYDMFGYPVNLNFNKKGPIHNTLLGGIFSILINSLMLLYWFFRLDVLIHSSGNTNTSTELLLEKSKQSYQFNDTNLIFTPRLNNVRKKPISVQYDDEAK